MEFEFDKEIDFLLRQTARGETAFFGEMPDSKFEIPDSKHLDADEISAFAENALPEKTRQSYVWHLADCEPCRKNLSGLVALNVETESEIIHAQTSAAEIPAPPVPWYQKLFAAPNLAYAMGALVMVFAGIGLFTVLQDAGLESSISQVSDKQPRGKGMSSDGDAAQQEVYSNNQMAANTAAISSKSSNASANSSNSAMSAAPVSSSNSNAAVMRSETGANLTDDRKNNKSLSAAGKPSGTPNAISADEAPASPPQQDDFELDGGEREKQAPASISQNQTTQNQSGQNQKQITPDTQNVQRAPMPAPKEQSREDKFEESKLVAKRKSAESTSVGGKTFNRSNSVWTDSAYRGQTTTNITRGTREYRKLDSGLRGIVENLGGTVIIVWKEKAYRIQ